MQTIISETDGFRFIAEVNDIAQPVGHVQLRFLTQWDHDKRNDNQRVQYSITLSNAQLKILKDIL